MSFNFESFRGITAKTHTEQGIWFLNGFWDEMEDKAEDIWEIVHLFLEVQLDRKIRYGRTKDEYPEESDLEEHRSHRLLEMMDETQTVVELRARLEELDIDNNHRMAVIEFLLDRYKKTPKQVINSPQGTVDPIQLAAAQAALDAAAESYAVAKDNAKAASKALAASKKAATEAAESAAASKIAAEEAVVAVGVVRKAEAELAVTVKEIEAIEEATRAKIAKLQKVIDGDGGQVKKGKAIQEKETILQEDPLPLRKAKITQNAALKRVTKARLKAEEAAANAKKVAENAADDKVRADEAAVAAAAAKAAAEEAERKAQAATDEAQTLFDELKNQGGTPFGKIWWMERVQTERKKYM